MNAIVNTGLDVLIKSDFSDVRGLKIGLVTNQTALSHDLRHIIDIILNANIDLRAIFAPEHGVAGIMQDGMNVETHLYKSTNIVVYSLYGSSKSPSDDVLDKLDAVLLDMQDIGCRYYTFIWTMVNVLISCSKNRKKLIILDRPNPINANIIEGNISEKEFLSFIGLYPIPARHGFTIGEFALFINEQFHFNTDIQIIRCEGYKRDMWFDETGLSWVLPSPNMPDPESALLYPGTCLLEGTNVSEGRGTVIPFKILGAPWIDADILYDGLNSIGLPGIVFRKVSFKPLFSKYSGINCNGVQIHIADRNLVCSVKTGLYIIKTIHDLFDEFDFNGNSTGKCHFDLLAGTDQIRNCILKKDDLNQLMNSWDESLRGFSEIRKSSLIYK